MPYSYHKEGDKYVVTKKDTGKVVGHTKGTKEALNKYLAALHINANEGKTNTMKKSELKEMIQEIIKEVMNESADINDPLFMKLRSLKDKKPTVNTSVTPTSKNSSKIKMLLAKRAQLMRDMEQEAELEGGPIADKYGDELTKIDKALSSLKEMTESITEAYVPSNIKDFAKRNGVSSLVNTVAGWAEKVGKRITGGTAIGKNYSTLILDMGYQTADIYINTEDGTIELYGEPVRNFNEFKNVFNSQQAEETNESVDYDTAVAYRLTVKGDRDAAMANVKALLDNLTTGKSKKFPEVKVVMLPSKGNPQDIILKLNGPGAFSMSKDIKARPELKGIKVSTYKPQLSKIS